PVPFVQTPAVEDNAAFSPDGRWIAYQSNESGEDEVYVKRFPDGAATYRVSRSGGTQPRWRADGKELFFLGEGAVMSADTTLTPSFASGAPRTLIPGVTTLVIRHAYAVAADGQRVLMPVLDSRRPAILTVIRIAQ